MRGIMQRVDVHNATQKSKMIYNRVFFDFTIISRYYYFYHMNLNIIFTRVKRKLLFLK